MRDKFPTGTTLQGLTYLVIGIGQICWIISSHTADLCMPIEQVLITNVGWGEMLRWFGGVEAQSLCRSVNTWTWYCPSRTQSLSMGLEFCFIQNEAHMGSTQWFRCARHGVCLLAGIINFIGQKCLIKG